MPNECISTLKSLKPALLDANRSKAAKQAKDEGPISARLRRRRVRPVVRRGAGIGGGGGGIRRRQQRRGIVVFHAGARGCRRCRGHPPGPRPDQGGEGEFQPQRWRVAGCIHPTIAVYALSGACLRSFFYVHFD